MPAKRIRLDQYITYSIYWLGLNMCTHTLTPVILPYLVARYAGETLKGSAYGLLRSAGLLVAVFVQPLAGMLSDRSTSRWGRRRPFIVLGTALDLVFLAIIALAPNYWILFGASLLLQFSSNIAHGALLGIIPDLVPPEQRGRASAAKAIMELLPVVLVAVTTGRLVAAGRVGQAIALLTVVLLATMVVTVLAVQERPLRAPAQEPLKLNLQRIGALTTTFGLATIGWGTLVGITVRAWAGRGRLQLAGVAVSGLLAMAGAIVMGVWGSARVGIGPIGVAKRPAYIWWIVNRLLFLAAVGSVSSFAQYFLSDVLRVSNAVQATSLLMLVVGLSTLLSAVPSGWLADRTGRKPIIVGAGIVAGAGTLLLCATRTLEWVYACGLLIGLATGAFMTTNWALGTDMVPADEVGRYLGISNLAGAGAGIVGAGIGGPLADFFNGYHPGLGYLVIFALYGMLFLLSSLIGLTLPQRSLAESKLARR